MGKGALLSYLITLHRHYGPVLDDSAPGAPHLSAEAADAWVASRFDESHLRDDAVAAAAQQLFGGRLAAADDATASFGTCDAAAFETVTAALSLGGTRAAPLQQGRYGFREHPPVADCAELVTRELANALLWCPDTQAFDVSRLPPSSRPAMMSFYSAAGGAYSADASQVWMDLVSDLPGVSYLAVRSSGPPNPPPHPATNAVPYAERREYLAAGMRCSRALTTSSLRLECCSAPRSVPRAPWWTCGPPESLVGRLPSRRARMATAFFSLSEARCLLPLPSHLHLHPPTGVPPAALLSRRAAQGSTAPDTL